MNLLNNLFSRLSFLDVAFGPSPTIAFGEADPATKVIVIVILVLFLASIGWFIYNSLKNK